MRTLIIPCAGKSTRFTSPIPKYLLRHPSGKMMVYESIQGLPLEMFDKIYIVVLSKHTTSVILKKLKDQFDEYPVEIVVLMNETKSASETISECIGIKNITGEIYIKDVDDYFFVNTIEPNQISTYSLNDAKFISPGNKSYVKKTINNHVLTIIEKKVISPDFCCGLYSFDSAEEFVSTFRRLENIIDEEIYISHVIYRMILDGKIFTTNEVETFIDWGTQQDWDLFKLNYKKMKTIKRNKCQVTHKKDLEYLHTFKDFPIFMGTTTQPEKDDILVDMDWVISKGSGIVQLKKLIPLDILYANGHNSGKIGEIWKDHHESFAKFIHQFKPESIFEIGGSQGFLSDEYKKHKLGIIKWNIIDPTIEDGKKDNVTFIKGIFDEKFVESNTFEYDTIIHSHVLEHIYKTDNFFELTSNLLSEGKLQIFSVPNLERMINLYYTNTLNFEHTIYLTEVYIDYLLNKNNFRIIKKEKFMDNHSIFYAVIKDSNVVKYNPNFLGLYEKNKKLFQNYITYFQNFISKINSSNKLLYLFGAHANTQYLIAYGLDLNKIICIIDNDKDKQGKRLYGTSFIVKSPDVLKNVDHPIIMLKMGVFDDEIKNDIFENYNKQAIFIK